MGGLETQTVGTTSVGTTGTEPGGQYVALSADHPANNAGSYAVESHLDSFFAGSGWTREDAQLVLSALSVALLLAWLYLEVQ